MSKGVQLFQVTHCRAATRDKRAIRVNIEIMLAFVSLGEALAAHKDLLGKLDGLEKRYDS